MCIDYCSLAAGVEGVLYLNGDVCLEYRVYCRRIDNLRTEVAELGCLNVAQVSNGVSVVDYTRVGSHESVHVGPYFKAVGL